MEQNKFTKEQMIAISILSVPDRNGLTMKEIAKKSGVSVATLGRWRNDENFINEIEKNNPEYNIDTNEKKREQAIKLLAEKKLSFYEIYTTIGISEHYLSTWRKDESFMKEVLKLNPLYYEEVLSDVQLEAIELLTEPKSERLSNVKIAKKLNVGSSSTIGYWLKNDLFNSELKKRTDEKILNAPYNAIFSDVQLEAIQLLTNYKKKHLTYVLIAEKLNISLQTLNSWRKDPEFLAAIKEEEEKEKDNNVIFSPIQLRAINLVSNEFKKTNTLTQIALDLKISYTKLKSWLKDEGIKN